MTALEKIAFIGFGEAARAFLKGWRDFSNLAARVSAYDIKTDSPDEAIAGAKRAEYASWRVEGARSAVEAVEGADAVFSVVTADQAHQAAVATLPGLKRGALLAPGHSYSAFWT